MWAQDLIPPPPRRRSGPPLRLPSVDALSIRSPVTTDRRAALLQGPRLELLLCSGSGGRLGQGFSSHPPHVAPFSLSQTSMGQMRFIGLMEKVCKRIQTSLFSSCRDLSLSQQSTPSLHPSVSSSSWRLTRDEVSTVSHLLSLWALSHLRFPASCSLCDLSSLVVSKSHELEIGPLFFNTEVVTNTPSSLLHPGVEAEFISFYG